MVFLSWSEPLPSFPDGGRSGGEASKPNFGCQVIIQSEQERQQMKVYRRGEKRERKKGKGPEDDPSDMSFNFDPKEMRSQR